MSSVPAIGIDLGTTFSCASVYRNGRAELIPNRNGHRLNPSTIFYDPNNGEVLVGKIAGKLSWKCPGNYLLDAKRFIGRQYDDEFVSRYTKSKHAEFSLIRGKDDQVAFQIEISKRRVAKKMEEVSAEVLKNLRTAASNYLGGNVTKAVVSVPAYFSNSQRKATRTAAELAGFEVLKLITEPTAAAIHYVTDKSKQNSNILVFDFGGGTLDISIINVKKGIFEVKAVYGDTLLGGRNIDEKLFEYFYKEFSDKCVPNFETTAFKRELYDNCIELKEALSEREDFVYFMSNQSGNANLSVSLTRAEFDELNKDLFQRITNIIEFCLDDSGFEKSAIDDVVLVGGSTRISKIQEMLSSYFGPTKIKTDLNPDEAVAAGASIHAALLLGDKKDLENYKVTEVTPMSLGLTGNGNLMTIFIPKNSPLPFKATRSRETVYNDQSAVLFTISEGERKNSKYNNKLGTFEINNLPKKRAGDVTFYVEFNLDEDGILTVTAKEKATGKNNKLVVTMGQFRLSENKIRTTCEDAKKWKKEDDMFETFIGLRSKLQKQVRHVLFLINDVLNEDHEAFIKKQSDTFLDDSENLPFTEIMKLEVMFEEYKNSVIDLLTKYNIGETLD